MGDRFHVRIDLARIQSNMLRDEGGRLKARTEGEKAKSACRTQRDEDGFRGVLAAMGEDLLTTLLPDQSQR